MGIQRFALSARVQSLLQENLDHLATLSSSLHQAVKEYKKAISEFDACTRLTIDEDDEMRAAAEEELDVLKKKQSMMGLGLLSEAFDSLGSQRAQLEIKACVGGSDAGNFMTDLTDYYALVANHLGYHYTLAKLTPLFGLVRCEGVGAVDILSFEAGIHRIQRVPETEAKGRMHTSTVSVAVLSKSAIEWEGVSLKDCKIEYMRSNGPGGQSANMSNSCVRLTHIPTGLSVTCQKFRSAFENQEEAVGLLATRIAMEAQRATGMSNQTSRRLQVRGGERSEKNINYNFPRDEIVNHQFGLEFHGIQRYLSGNFLPETLAIYLLHSLINKQRLEDEDPISKREYKYG